MNSHKKTANKYKCSRLCNQSDDYMCIFSYWWLVHISKNLFTFRLERGIKNKQSKQQQQQKKNNAKKHSELTQSVVYKKNKNNTEKKACGIAHGTENKMKTLKSYMYLNFEW